MEFSGNNVNELYHEAWWKMKVVGKTEASRNGPVITIQEPVIMKLYNPTQRILTCPTRDCNPFFHIAETVWMLAGSNDVNFVTQFNSRYRNYADDGTEIVWGAYGHRWRYHWDFDQIQGAIDQLGDATTRQVVIGMWDPLSDLNTYPHNDRPCNTQIMLRVVDGRLNMLVTNRSNDLVWGALGANIVHFTYLHELIARAAGYELGVYQVVTNNLHVYPGMPRFDKIMAAGLSGFSKNISAQYPILIKGEDYYDLKIDCERAVHQVLLGEEMNPIAYDCRWMQAVAIPMMNAYLAGKDNLGERSWWIDKVVDGWQEAAQAWLVRRTS